MNIVFVSHSAFHHSMVVGSHQLSRVYARAGHRVLHLSLPFSAAHIVRLARPQMLPRLRKALQGPLEREPNLFEWVPLSLMPWDLAKHVLGPGRINLTVPLARRIRRVLNRLAMDHIDLALIDDSRMVGIEAVLDADRVVYRATDLYGQYRKDGGIIQAEKKLIDRVDGLFATSEAVADHLRKISGRHVDVFPNGFDDDHFCRQRDPHGSLQPMARPRAVYVGAVDHRFDLSGVIGLADQRPNLQVLVYGPVTLEVPADIPSNLHLMGSLPYESLPAVLQHCDVALLPLRDIPENHGRSPMKYYEYRAAGLPIAAFAADSLRPLSQSKGPFLYETADSAGLVSATDACLEFASAAGRIPMEDCDRTMSWKGIAQRMLAKIADLEQPQLT